VAISVTGRPADRRYGLFGLETLSQSTATVPQAVAVTTDLTTIAGGTATGIGVNLFTLANGTEGQEKEIILTGTGEAKILPLLGTSTGWHVLSETDDGLSLRFLNAKWRVKQSMATTASAT